MKVLKSSTVAIVKASPRSVAFGDICESHTATECLSSRDLLTVTAATANPSSLVGRTDGMPVGQSVVRSPQAPLTDAQIVSSTGRLGEAASRMRRCDVMRVDPLAVPQH